MPRLLAGIGLLIVTLLVTLGCLPSPVTGSGRLSAEERPVGDIGEVSLAGPGRLIITQGEVERLTIEAEDNILPHVSSAIHQRQLKLRLAAEPGVPVRATLPIVYRLTVRDLDAIELSGSGSVEAETFRTERLRLRSSAPGTLSLSDLRGETLDVTLSGAGAISVVGVVRQQWVKVSGGGAYRAEDLQSEEASVTVTGAGEATVRVRGALTAHIDGGGAINYLGNPTITEQISGGQLNQLGR